MYQLDPIPRRQRAARAGGGSGLVSNILSESAAAVRPPSISKLLDEKCRPGEEQNVFNVMFFISRANANQQTRPTDAHTVCLRKTSLRLEAYNTYRVQYSSFCPPCPSPSPSVGQSVSRVDPPSSFFPSVPSLLLPSFPSVPYSGCGSLGVTSRRHRQTDAWLRLVKRRSFRVLHYSTLATNSAAE